MIAVRVSIVQPQMSNFSIEITAERNLIDRDRHVNRPHESRSVALRLVNMETHKEYDRRLKKKALRKIYTCYINLLRKRCWNISKKGTKKGRVQSDELSKLKMGGANLYNVHKEGNEHDMFSARTREAVHGKQQKCLERLAV